MPDDAKLKHAAPKPAAAVDPELWEEQVSVDEDWDEAEIAGPGGFGSPFRGLGRTWCVTAGDD